MNRKDRDEELERELRAHMEMEADELRERGLSAADATYAARRAFGSQALAMERTRATWNWNVFEAVGRNVRLALRRARHTPGFTLTVALVIALAVGATTAIFALIDVAFLKPLPYPEQDRLAYVTMTWQAAGRAADELVLTGMQWEVLRDHATLFEPAVYSEWTAGINCGVGDKAFFVQQQRVGADFFRVLGVQPAFGRGFTKEEDAENGPRAAVLSEPLRRRVFGDAPDAVGQKLLLRGEPYTVVGVMPAGFRSGVNADVWTPLKPSTRGEGGGNNYQAMIRLKPGVSEAAAAGEVESISRVLPAPKPSRDGTVWESRFRMQPLLEGRTSNLRKPLLLLLGAVGIVLLIGAINVGGLLLARQSGRAAELATRMALGASRGQVFRDVLLDSMVMVVIGGALAIPMAYISLEGLRRTNDSMFSLVESAEIDARSLAAGVLCTILAGFIAGLLPAWQSARTPGGNRSVAGRKRLIPLGVLVSVQVALVVPLLVGAGLLGRTFLKLWGVNAGFDPNNLIMARISLQDARYDSSEKVQRLFREGVARMQALPGVEGVGAGLTVPYERQLNQGVRVGAQPVPGERFRNTNLVYTTPGYLDVLRIPLLRGRALRESDTDPSAPVAVVNEAFVRRFLDGREGVGEYIRLGGKEPVQIVGVCGNTAQRNSERGAPVEPMAAAYSPVSQVSIEAMRTVHQWFSPAWIVRSKLQPEVLSRQLESVMGTLDPMLPLSKFTTPEQLKSQALGMQRLLLSLLGALSGLGLLLCVLGVYGLVASSVAERTREIGIRLALGASVPGVIQKAMRPGLLWSLAGILAGVPLLYLGRTVLAGLIYGVSEVDPLTYLGIAVVLLAAVGAASLLPALKLTRLDPAVTLRNE
ncbi:MAG: ABC transporter permease [Acidobacteria bacterium]|nr:ABC transporter permease [Acidobacteriota bacterium]